MKHSKEKVSVSDRNIGFFQKEGVSTVYIGNMSYAKNEQDIKAIFEKFGTVSYVRLILDVQTHKSKGFAFVQMTNDKDSQKAIKSLNGTQLDGRTLKVSIALENADPKKSNPAKKVIGAKKPIALMPSKKQKEVQIKKEKKVPEQGLEALFSYLGSKK